MATKSLRGVFIGRLYSWKQQVDLCCCAFGSCFDLRDNGIGQRHMGVGRVVLGGEAGAVWGPTTKGSANC